MTTEAERRVRVEILARQDCQCRGMARIVVERVIDELNIPVEVTVIEITSTAQARKRGFLGSPSVRVNGLDVEPGTNGSKEVSLGDRVYRGDRGLQGWPDSRWIRAALVVAHAASSDGGGEGDAPRRSSTTSP
ncbi:MAG: hypothetical protein M3364_06780 [Actinomycetota bacterium]|nr:hypothetical protein [Actinomycetota bacterium]